MERIKEFVTSSNPNLSDFENLKLQNRSNHDNLVHQYLFNSIENFSKTVIKDIYNNYANILFESNQLNIISNEKIIEELIVTSLKNQGHNVTTLANPELIYKGFNFVKPSNLLPRFNKKLTLIKQLGVSESEQHINYLFNPYFFGFKLCFDIFVNCLFCDGPDRDIERGLVKILNDKYGPDYHDIYEYVSQVSIEHINAGRVKQDQKDETFITGIKTIAGVDNDKVLYNFIYESVMISSNRNARAFKS